MSEPSINEGKPSETAAQEKQPTAEEVTKIITELRNEAKEKEQKYLYLYAEFENYKKRMIKERSDLIKFGSENFARDLLQVIDNLERALNHVPQNVDKSLMEGLNMVVGQFRATLQKQGVQPIETAKKNFDPNLHEAVGQAPSEQPAGIIMEECSRGYTLHGRLLRPARVIISMGPQQAGPPAGAP